MRIKRLRSTSGILLYNTWHELVMAQINCSFPLYFLTSLLIPWCRYLPEKLTGLHLVKKLSAFYGTRRFITAFTSARHLSQSWARSIQSIPLHPTSWRPILILSSHLRLSLPIGLFPQVSPPKPCIPLLSPYMLHAPSSNSSRFYHPNNIGWAVQNIKLLIT